MKVGDPVKFCEKQHLSRWYDDKEHTILGFYKRKDGGSNWNNFSMDDLLDSHEGMYINEYLIAVDNMTGEFELRGFYPPFIKLDKRRIRLNKLKELGI